jgi:hypothetical protein
VQPSGDAASNSSARRRSALRVLCHFRHALDVSSAYEEIHRLTGVDAGVFHRHYNLKPWLDEGNRRSLHNLAVRYRDTFPTNG